MLRMESQMQVTWELGFYKGYVVVLTEEGEERLKPLNRGRWYLLFDRILKRFKLAWFHPRK